MMTDKAWTGIMELQKDDEGGPSPPPYPPQVESSFQSIVRAIRQTAANSLPPQCG